MLQACDQVLCTLMVSLYSSDYMQPFYWTSICWDGLFIWPVRKPSPLLIMCGDIFFQCVQLWWADSVNGFGISFDIWYLASFHNLGFSVFVLRLIPCFRRQQPRLTSAAQQGYSSPPSTVMTIEASCFFLLMSRLSPVEDLLKCQI